MVNQAPEKPSLTSLTMERSIKNSPLSEGSEGGRIETEEKKEGLRSALTVGSPQKRLAAVASKTTVGEDTSER